MKKKFWGILALVFVILFANNFCAAESNYRKGSSLITRGIEVEELDEKKSSREKISTPSSVKKVQQKKSPDEIKIAQLLANSETAQKTDQILLVIGNERRNAKGLFSLWNKNSHGGWERAFEVDCGYGTKGLSSNRHAGDKTTPIGSFPILYAFGLVDNPGTSMAYRKITPRSYLSSDYSTYNQWVESSWRIPGEHLITYYQYKYAMNIGFNINPTIYGKGAGIFLHCKSTDTWNTSGCVSLHEEDMLEVLLSSHDGEYIIIVPNVDDISLY